MVLKLFHFYRCLWENMLWLCTFFRSSLKCTVNIVYKRIEKIVLISPEFCISNNKHFGTKVSQAYCAFYSDYFECYILLQKYF